MNKILLEEIKRFNLLSKYDNKNTLTENVEKHNIGLLLEQGIFKDLLRIFGGEERLIAKELQNVFKETDVFFSTTGKELKTGEELFTALRESRIANKEMAKINKSLLKNGSTLEIKTAAADNFAKNRNFAEALNIYTDDEIIKRLTGPPGNYSKADAELLLDRLNKSGYRIKPGGGVIPVKPNEIKPNAGGGKPPITGNKTKIQKIKDTIKNTKNWVFAKRWRKIAVIGGAIGLWLWLTSDDDSPFPACLAAKIPQSEFDKMKDETPDYLLVKTTGNKEIDSYGGGKFYTNGDFKFGNDSMSGKWEESTDKVTITVGSKTYELPCQEVPQDNSGGGGGTIPPPPPTDEDASITFTDCDKFPFKLGCINNKIKDVQDCLSVPKTGKFDTKTKNALKDKGYGETITQEIYNTIMTKCGKLDKVENDYKYLMSTGGQSRTDY